MATGENTARVRERGVTPPAAAENGAPPSPPVTGDPWAGDALDGDALDGDALGGDARDPCLPDRAPVSDAARPADEAGAPGTSLASDPAFAAFAPPALGPGDRLLRFAYRAGLTTAALRPPFGRRRRLRLQATVACPLHGDPAAGEALLGGQLLLPGGAVPINELDLSGSRLPPSARRAVHGFAWLPDLAAAAPREVAAPVAEAITARWLEADTRQGAAQGEDEAWDVGCTGQRLLLWLVHAPLLLGGSDRRQRARVLRAMAETARWLDRHVGRAGNRQHEVAGWCAIVAAGLLLPEGKGRLLYGEAGLQAALGELVGEDGGVLSRSPLAQMETAALMVRLAACYRAIRQRPPETIERLPAILVPPLLALRHGDGALGSWQGGWPIAAARIEALVAASDADAHLSGDARPPLDARQWGYQRVEAGPAVLQLDAAPPPAPRRARDGCASTLAFELSHGADRIVVNCGGAALAGGSVPTRLAQGLRATAAHSTLVLNDSNSTAVLAGGRLGHGVGEVSVDRGPVVTEAGAATRIEASHDGYLARFGLLHRRALTLRDDGGALLGQDTVEPAGRRARRSAVPFAIRFHLGAGVLPVLADEGGSALLALAGGGLWRFSSHGLVDGAATLGIEDSLWIDGSGRPGGTRQLVLTGLVPRGGGTWSWLLERLEDEG